MRSLERMRKDFSHGARSWKWRMGGLLGVVQQQSHQPGSHGRVDKPRVFSFEKHAIAGPGGGLSSVQIEESRPITALDARIPASGSTA